MTNSYLYIYIDSHNTTNIEMDLRITNIDDAKCMIKSLSNYDILYIYINHKSDINDAILMIFLKEYYILMIIIWIFYHHLIVSFSILL